MGPPNWGGHYRLCDRPQLGGRRARVFDWWERHYWRQRQRRGGADWYRGKRSGELGTPCQHVFVLEEQRSVVVVLVCDGVLIGVGG